MKNKIIIIILIILAFVFSFLIFKYIPYKQPIAEVHNYECQNEEYENSTYYLQSDKDYYLTSEKIVSTIHYADEYTYRCMVNSYHNNDNISYCPIAKR